MSPDTNSPGAGRPWRGFFQKRNYSSDEGFDEKRTAAASAWNMGMLNSDTIEVPGSVLLLSKERNEPLGLRNAPARTSHSSLPTGWIPEPPVTPAPAEDELGKKKTADGEFILDPQPDDSHNDPLNWPAWRRDLALISLGLYCMVGGGTTPIIAAGFTNVAKDYGINVAEVSYTTGLYMTGLGIGSVIFSPTAILYGKRPVYLFSSILYILTSVWCALSPNFPSLILARIFQGIAVSPVECLPSATIAEIFFLHERAYRIGIYTLLLLGGKNLVPLVSAAIIQRLSWRWVFWILAIVVGFCGTLLFFFVPETFWDRSPVPRQRRVAKRPSFFSRRSTDRHFVPIVHAPDTGAASQNGPVTDAVSDPKPADDEKVDPQDQVPVKPKRAHVGFASHLDDRPELESQVGQDAAHIAPVDIGNVPDGDAGDASAAPSMHGSAPPSRPDSLRIVSRPSYQRRQSSYTNAPSRNIYDPVTSDTESAKTSWTNWAALTRGQAYTHKLREAPPQSFKTRLRIHNGRINQDKWWKATVRPFILYSYPAVLWSAAVYACSIGWLIVISESIAIIYRDGVYKFGALATGLVYISPFIGGVLGTAVAGRVSDVIVKRMAKRNGGLYEPEFRLVMVIPITITTVMGLIGFGWSAGIDDHWIVPTVFFGLVSFGCSLGSTTSITFCVDSYRQYAGEALVTLNFSKNIYHGLVFSLFVTRWLEADGPRSVYMYIGIIQLLILLTTIPMYIYGKRARMWTVRKNFMEKF
ncbi:MFS general substrate transporter [Xylariaceae sp. FL0255]|nr:MFS general substrate transporter [Xylariaceae sp. FL0255]